VEEELAAGLVEGKIAELVDDDEVVASEGFGQSAAAPGRLLCLGLIDEIDEVEEAPARSGADHCRGDGDRQVRLACAGAADEDEIALGIEKGTGRQLADLALNSRLVVNTAEAAIDAAIAGVGSGACSRTRS
jgi:hypothetical protein